MTLTSDMCPDLWGELEFAAMRRQTFAENCRVAMDPAHFDKVEGWDLFAALELVLAYSLADGRMPLKSGRRIFVRQADMRWRQ